MTTRFVLLLFWFAAAGCGSSHTSPDGGTPDVDSSTPDALPPRPADAAPDTDVDPIVWTSCDGELLSAAGDPCFCQGPFAVSNGIAYRASFEIEVHEVSDGEVVDLGRVTQARPGSEGAVAIADDHLFVGGWGLEVFDLAAPTTPRSVTVIDLEGAVTDLFVERATMWVGFDGRDETGALIAYDVSDPTAPREIESLPLEGRPGSVLPYGDSYVIVLEARRFGDDGPDTAAVIDISRPSAPEVAYRIELSGRSVLRRRADIEGGTLYVVGSEPLLQVIDIESSRIVGSIDAPDGASAVGLGITVADGLAFVGAGQVAIADVAGPDAPRWIGSIPTAGDAFYLQKNGDQLFVSGGGSLSMFSLGCR